MLVVDVDILWLLQMLLIAALAARTIRQIVLHALSRIAAVLTQDAQLGNEIQLVGEVLRARGVGVDVPVVCGVAEGGDV